jgi:hypothetical protein
VFDQDLPQWPGFLPKPAVQPFNQSSARYEIQLQGEKAEEQIAIVTRRRSFSWRWTSSWDGHEILP